MHTHDFIYDMILQHVVWEMKLNYAIKYYSPGNEDLRDLIKMHVIRYSNRPLSGIWPNLHFDASID